MWEDLRPEISLVFLGHAHEMSAVPTMNLRFCNLANNALQTNPADFLGAVGVVKISSLDETSLVQTWVIRSSILNLNSVYNHGETSGYSWTICCHLSSSPRPLDTESAEKS